MQSIQLMESMEDPCLLGLEKQPSGKDACLIIHSLAFHACLSLKWRQWITSSESDLWVQVVKDDHICDDKQRNLTKGSKQRKIITSISVTSCSHASLETCLLKLKQRQSITISSSDLRVQVAKLIKSINLTDCSDASLETCLLKLKQRQLITMSFSDLWVQVAKMITDQQIQLGILAC